ncbi:nudix hydrolase 18, mitochondrial-like [Rhodamnia argentea]|uniref:Nudix hydrolase 18, mitochondrial-like n=1 Tax=Rhodamnia argentea TaxID=178133 RepID=A0A8B8NH18_9MYRT|nr:nudix hydrolase 18, mitochondrial-like [Rhodamnia argentea]
MGLSLSRNLLNFLLHFSPKKSPGNLFSVQIEDVVSLVSRTGRHLQRYDKGRRQVVGCIPYRYKKTDQSSGGGGEELEFLVVSSQKGKRMMFPKGGWEIDETIEEAALRETAEEAGVTGTVEGKLGKWQYKSKSNGSFHDGHMFPLLVEEQLDSWPEKHIRQRLWVTADEAKELCQQLWMKEALELLVQKLRQQQNGYAVERQRA